MPCFVTSQKSGGRVVRKWVKDQGRKREAETYHNQCPNLQRQSKAIVIQTPLQNRRYESSDKACAGEKYAIRHPLSSNEPFI